MVAPINPINLLAAALLVPAIAALPATTTTAHTPAFPAITGICTRVAPCITSLRAYPPASSFCSSWLGISTRTSTVFSTSTFTSTSTSVVTTTTATQTVPANTTVTVSTTAASIVQTTVSQTITGNATTTYAPTPTVTASPSLTTITSTTTTVVCGSGTGTNTRPTTSTGPTTGPAKRAAASSSSSKGASASVSASVTIPPSASTNKPIPTQLRNFASTVVSSACSCLNLPTPTTTVTSTRSTTVVSTVTRTTSVAATQTTTGTVTSTITRTSTSTALTTATPTTTVTPPPVTETPTSTVTEVTTTTVRAGQAAVQLTNPTPITPIVNGRAAEDLDDRVGWRINDIPFDVGLYGVTSRNLIVGINGWVSPGTTETGVFQNTELPNNQAGDPSWVAYWSDLFITRNTTQGIYYAIDGDEGHRTLTVEYFMSFYRRPEAYTHFLITLFEDEIGRVVYSFAQTTDEHAELNPQLGTVGVQNPAGGQFNQYSYNAQPPQGLVIEWRPSTNQWREISAGSC